jgi:hypothetical protein
VQVVLDGLPGLTKYVKRTELNEGTQIRGEGKRSLRRLEGVEKAEEGSEARKEGGLSGGGNGLDSFDPIEVKFDEPILVDEKEWKSDKLNSAISGAVQRRLEEISRKMSLSEEQKEKELSKEINQEWTSESTLLSWSTKLTRKLFEIIQGSGEGESNNSNLKTQQSSERNDLESSDPNRRKLQADTSRKRLEEVDDSSVITYTEESPGYPVGGFANGKYFIFNHVSIMIQYHYPPEELNLQGVRIVGFLVEPRSRAQACGQDERP